MPRINIRKTVKANKADYKAYKAFADRVFYRALKDQVKPVLENFSVQVSSAPMARAYNQVYSYVGTDAAKKEYARLKKQETGQKADLIATILLNTWRAWMRAFVIEKLGKRITEVTANTQNKINEALQESLEAGETRRQTAKRIYDNTLGRIGRSRARLISRTETTTARNVGKAKSADDWGSLTGAEMYKKWIHSYSKFERPSHVDEQSKPPIAKSEKFQVYNPETGGINYMDLPGDQTAPAEQVCNCNCVAVFMSKRFAERNYGLYR